MIGHPARRERRRKIAAFVRKHGSTTEAVSLAAETFCLGIQTVRNACYENGLRLPRSNTNPATICPSTYAIIADLCNTDDTHAVIGERHGLTVSWVGQVYRKAKKYGIPVRTRTRGKK